MDPRPPVRLSPRFGPFDGEALQVELNRIAAGQAFRCAALQAAVVVAGLAVAALFVTLFWGRLQKYEQLLAHCAGV